MQGSSAAPVLPSAVPAASLAPGLGLHPSQLQAWGLPSPVSTAVQQQIESALKDGVLDV